MLANNKQKYCPRCKKYLPLTSFSKNVHQKDGLQVYCVDCCAAYSKEYWAKRKEKKMLQGVADMIELEQKAQNAQEAQEEKKDIVVDPFENTNIVIDKTEMKTTTTNTNEVIEDDPFKNLFDDNKVETPKKTREQIRKENEGVKRKEKPSLLVYDTADLVKELQGRGVFVLVNPTPQEMLARLKELGYSGPIHYTHSVTEEIYF